MAKREVIATEPGLPAFMQADTQLGVENMTGFIRPPRMKFIQKLTPSPLIDMFNPGDIIASPLNVLISGVEVSDNGRPTTTGKPFTFTPLFFYPEWVSWAPRGAEQAILDRSTDPQSKVATLARNPSTRNEESTGVKHLEHLNFIVVAHVPGFELTPMVMSFSRAEWKTGSNFCALSKMRNAPLFGMVFETRSTLKTNPKGQWFGHNVTNPEGEKWIADPTQYEAYKKMHLEFAKAHAEARLVTDHEEHDEVDM